MDKVYFKSWDEFINSYGYNNLQQEEGLRYLKYNFYRKYFDFKNFYKDLNDESIKEIKENEDGSLEVIFY